MTSSYKKRLLDYEACLPFVFQRVATFQYSFISSHSPFFPVSFFLSLPPSLTHTYTHTHTHTQTPHGRSVVKNLPASVGDTGSILGAGRPVEKKMATHSSILAWRILWMEEHGEPSVTKELDMT